jgi:hypothetical protein
MKHLVVGMLVVTAACSGGSGGRSAGGDDVASPDAGGKTIPYQPFTTHTRSLNKQDGYQISTTDLIGPIACGLATDQSAGLGTSGSQVILAFTDLDFQNCPVGTYAIRSGCEIPTMGGFTMFVPDACAYFRKYDQQGKLLGTAVATAGAIGVSGTESNCQIQVNLSFAGQTHSDTFTLTNWPMSWPWCK